MIHSIKPHPQRQGTEILEEGDRVGGGHGMYMKRKRIVQLIQVMDSFLILHQS